MAPEKTKPGVVGALSRILHLHQLPEMKTPAVPLSKDVPLSGNKPNTLSFTPVPGPLVPEGYATKSYIIPEARRAAMPTPIISSPPAIQPNASLAPAARPISGGASTSNSAPSINSKKDSSWPFPATWMKTPGAAPNASPAPATVPGAAVSPRQSAAIPVPMRPASVTLSSSPAARTSVQSNVPTSIPATTLKSVPGTASAVPTPPSDSPSASSVPLSANAIVTNFDRILDFVKLQKNIKLDELTKRMGLAEEKIAEELQTLEDNGLIEVRYPAFGEPIIYYKG